MFVVDCPGHGARTVLSYSSLVDLHQRDGVIQLRLRCWCGTTISHLTGKAVDGARVEAPAA